MLSINQSIKPASNHVQTFNMQSKTDRKPALSTSRTELKENNGKKLKENREQNLIGN